MGAHGVFCLVAIVLAIATIAILIATKRVRNGWMPWLAIPIVAFLWYCLLVGFLVGYYMWRIGGVRG